MLTKAHIKKIIRQHRAKLREDFNVQKLGIFGSYVQGSQDPESDIDILVEFAKPVGFFTFLDLEDYLEKLLNNKVDLVTPKALKPRIGKRILKEIVYV